jgi:hypothetical protein
MFGWWDIRGILTDERRNSEGTAKESDRIHRGMLEERVRILDARFWIFGFWGWFLGLKLNDIREWKVENREILNDNRK